MQRNISLYISSGRQVLSKQKKKCNICFIAMRAITCENEIFLSYTNIGLEENCRIYLKIKC